MHQSTTPSLSRTIWPRWASRHFLTLLIVQTLLPVTFAYSLSSEAVVVRQLRRWKKLWRRSLTRSHKRTSMRPSRGCWNGTTSALQPEELTSKGIRVSGVYYQEKCPYKKSLETYLMILVYIYIYIYIYNQVGFDRKREVFSMKEIQSEPPFPCDYVITWTAESKRLFFKIPNCTLKMKINVQCCLCS